MRFSPNTAALRTSRMNSLLFAVAAMITGAVTAYGALAFLLLIDLSGSFFYGPQTHGRYLGFAALPWWHVLLATTLGGLLVGVIVAWLLAVRRNHGPADVLESIREKDAELSLRTGLESAVVSAVSIGAGASVGRYGPAVHLGASLSAWLAQRLHLDRSRRVVLLGCGVASAVAASFNAPLAGVLFVYEFMLGPHALRSFVPITIASVVGTAITRTHLGDVSIFAISRYEITNNYEYLLLALLGVLCGALAIAFMRSADWAMRTVGRSPIPLWLRPMLGGLLLGVIGIQFPQILGLGEHAIDDAFNQVFPVGMLLLLVAAKLMATTISLGFGFSGGVFGPALFLGAMLGDALGQLVAQLMPGLVAEPSIYALAGMGAVISCVIGAPLTTILIVFELTSNYAITTAVMLTVVFGTMLSSRFFTGSFFRFQLEQRGVDVSSGREVTILRGRTVAELMHTDFPVTAPDTPLSEALQQLAPARPEELIVVDEHGELTGMVSLADVTFAIQTGRGDAPVANVAQMPKVVLETDESLHKAMRLMENIRGIGVPVVDNRLRMRVVGFVHESDVLRAYGTAVDQARREERGELE